MILYTKKHRVPFEVDDEAVERVNKYTWCVVNGHIATNLNGTIVYLQSIVMENKPPEGHRWTHLNGDHKDNRSDNIGVRTYTPNKPHATQNQIKAALEGRGQLPDGVTVELNENFIVPFGIPREELRKM